VSYEKKYDLNADGKDKSISFSRGSKPVMFQYVIGDSDFERVDVINDLGVLVDSRMNFVDHLGRNRLECWDLLNEFQESSMTFPSTERFRWLLSGQVWSMHRVCGRLIKRFIRRGLSAFNTTL
jgi:hypothetical protein